MISVLSFFWLFICVFKVLVPWWCEWVVKISGLWSLEHSDLSYFKSELLKAWLLFGPCLMGHPIALCCLLKRKILPLAWLSEWFKNCAFNSLNALSLHVLLISKSFIVMILLWFHGLCSFQHQFHSLLHFACLLNRKRNFVFFAQVGFFFPFFNTV